MCPTQGSPTVNRKLAKKQKQTGAKPLDFILDISTCLTLTLITKRFHANFIL